MLTTSRSTLLPLALGLAGALTGLAAGCAADGDRQIPGIDDPATGEEVVSGLDPLLEGAPGNDALPEEGKADAVYPRQFDLLSTQSPVRNQRSRGVCSIFSTVALMEHLYLKEGTIATPDFSEQYLQWSTKVLLGAFTNTEGSSAERNLEAIHRFGIPEESAWPYQPTKWNTTNDPACTGGDDVPVRCHTNGDPPESARAARMFTLPRGRWIRSTPSSIKAHMTTKRTAVVVGGDFFYQAWNHGGSRLPISQAYKRKGYVTTPNAEDIADSRMRRAGHSFLLVGWDDDLEVQRLDAMGQPMVDAMGRPVMDRGFFLFKNSWGTGSFGVENPKGDGYGWISYRYTQDYLTAYVSDLPTVTVPEVCDNGVDDDRDGRTDCDDNDCAATPACAPAGTMTTTHASTMGAAIPDNTPAGIRSEITVAPGGPIMSVVVHVDITHPYRGDLIVKLVHPSGREVVLSDRQGAGDDDLKRAFTVTQLGGLDAAGTWALVVADVARSDVGRLNSWGLEIARGGGAMPMPPPSTTYENTTPTAIPDNNRTGARSDIVVPSAGAGAIRTMQVTVDITHPYRGDLTIKLSKVGGPETVLLMADGSDADDVRRTFDVTAFAGVDAAGTWRLTVIDEASGDVGRLNFWRLTIGR
jgi:subtilisin-like proprotein convertase family protein